MQRIPKLKGFTNPFRVEYTPVNLDDPRRPGRRRGHGRRPWSRPVWCARKALVKVLGQGSLTRPVRVSAHAFSTSAEAAITAAGGSVERVPLPFGHGRPPASGNALMNR